jgi:pimeloyl-ACP methyl ester carboxylesterase
MGGMLAAELAALAPQRVRKLVLVAPTGFWLDDHPIPDFFAMAPEDLGRALFHDPTSPLAQATLAIPADDDARAAMLIERVKRLAAAARVLWPIPDKGLRKRIHRITAPTLLLWGESDRLIPLVYAEEFLRRLQNAKLQIVKEAGHMLPYEQPAEFGRFTTAFCKQ